MRDGESGGGIRNAKKGEKKDRKKMDDKRRESRDDYVTESAGGFIQLEKKYFKELRCSNIWMCVCMSVRTDVCV